MINVSNWHAVSGEADIYIDGDYWPGCTEIFVADSGNLCQFTYGKSTILVTAPFQIVQVKKV